MMFSYCFFTIKKFGIYQKQSFSFELLSVQGWFASSFSLALRVASDEAREFSVGARYERSAKYEPALPSRTSSNSARESFQTNIFKSKKKQGYQ